MHFTWFIWSRDSLICGCWWPIIWKIFRPVSFFKHLVLQHHRFVRREKEIAESRYEIAQGESLRYRLRVEHLEHELKEVQDSLSAAKERMQVGFNAGCFIHHFTHFPPRKLRLDEGHYNPLSTCKYTCVQTDQATQTCKYCMWPKVWCLFFVGDSKDPGPAWWADEENRNNEHSDGDQQDAERGKRKDGARTAANTSKGISSTVQRTGVVGSTELNR